MSSELFFRVFLLRCLGWNGYPFELKYVAKNLLLLKTAFNSLISSELLPSNR